MTQAQHRLEQAIEAAREYRRHDLSGDVARVDQLERTIDDLVGYLDERDGRRFLTWPSVVARVTSGEAR
jgi:hypothetical protein